MQNLKILKLHCTLQNLMPFKLVEKTDEFGYKYQQHKFKLIKG